MEIKHGIYISKDSKQFEKLKKVTETMEQSYDWIILMRNCNGTSAPSPSFTFTLPPLGIFLKAYWTWAPSSYLFLLFYSL